jgi:predicted Fe-Mo cluster-binding NifX family protein
MFSEYLASVRKPLLLEFVIPDSIRNPGFHADFGNWIPAFAGMTSERGLLGLTLYIQFLFLVNIALSQCIIANIARLQDTPSRTIRPCASIRLVSPSRAPGMIIALFPGMDTIAITFWDGRVSPLFDAAATVLIVAPEGEPKRISLGSGSLWEKAALLEKNDVTILICGAISAEALAALQEHSIKVFPWVSGPVSEVLSAHRDGSLDNPRFTMPGCMRRQRCHRSGRSRKRGYSRGRGGRENN